MTTQKNPKLTATSNEVSETSRTSPFDVTVQWIPGSASGSTPRSGLVTTPGAPSDPAGRLNPPRFPDVTVPWIPGSASGSTPRSGLVTTPGAPSDPAGRLNPPRFPDVTVPWIPGSASGSTPRSGLVTTPGAPSDPAGRRISAGSLAWIPPSGNVDQTETFPDYNSSRVIVKFKDGVTQQQMDAVLQANNIRTAITVSLTGAQIWELAANSTADQVVSQNQNNPLLEYIEFDYAIKPAVVPTATIPNDPGFAQLWGLNNTGQAGGTPDADIDAPEAWESQKGSASVVVGVIDTGVDYNHQDLAANIWTNPGEIPNDGIDNDSNGYVDDFRGWDFAYNDSDPMDVYGHGTHVSGTIAAKGNNGIGVTGVSWNSKIMPVKFLNDQGSGYTSNAVLALNYAAKMGVKITNNSWGGGSFSQALYDSIKAAGNSGALFIAAAGNDARDTDASPSYPASYDLPNIISVAATTRTDSLSYFSNYGKTTVDLGAPGSEIYSTTPNNSYATYNGTSMATPHVSGVAALVWSQNPGWTWNQVKAAILDNGDPLPALAGKTLTGKRLNAAKAIGSVPTPPETILVDDRGWYDDTGYHNASNDNYIVGDAIDYYYRNWMSFQLPTFTQPVTAAELIIKAYEVTGSETYQLRDVVTPVDVLKAGGTGKTAIYNDLGEGAIYGSRDFTKADTNQVVTISLNSSLVAALNAKSGQSFAMGGVLTTLNTIRDNEFVYGVSNDSDPNAIQLKLTYGTSLPVVSVVASDPTAQEGVPLNPGRFTLTRTGPTTSSLAVNIGMTGTATNGVDYTTIPSVAIFAAGSAIAVVNVNVIDDALSESTETAILTVLPGSGYVPGSVNPGSLGGSAGSSYASAAGIPAAASATVTILDNDAPVTIIEANDTGWYNSSGNHDSGNTNYLAGDNNLNDGWLYRNWMSFQLPTFTQSVISAKLLINAFSVSGSETYQLRDVITPVAELRAGGTGKTAIYSDLGNGTIYGSRNFTTADSNNIVTINLNSSLVAALNAKSGQAFAMGGLITTLDTVDNSEYVYGFSAGSGNVKLELTFAASLPVVTMAANYSGVSEDGKTDLVYTLTRSGLTTNPLTVNFALSGTATRMTDYKAYGATFTTSTTGTVTFAAGSAVAQVDVVTKADTSKESNETIGLQITSGSGYTIGTVSPVITTIINDDLVANQKGTSGADVLTSGNTKILSGGDGADVLIGEMAGEIFVGGNGIDNITTGLGNDIVSFTAKSQGVDVITDFDPTYDLIQVAATFGGGLTAGQTIDDTQFSKSLSLLTTATRFIYDQTSGGMFFDVDGSGPTAAVKLATLNATLTNFSAENIFVV